MYSQLKNDQSANGFEKPWSMDLVTRRSKRRSSILGKGRTSLRLSVAGIIPSVAETSPAKIGADKPQVTSGAARKPIADDVLRHFARTNGINPLNPFASQLKESVGSGQSLDENEQELNSCSAPSSSSEGSARKEDPDITGVFFMDDVESVKKRQLAASSSTASSGQLAASTGTASSVEGAATAHHLVPCNLMTRSPFAAPKQPLKDQALRLNREAGSRSTLTSSSSNKRRTMGGAEKPTRDYSTGRQPVLSPVAPVLSCDSERYLKTASLSSSLSRSMRSEPESVDCASVALRKSLSTTDLTNCIVNAPGCTSRDARRAASEMHFEQMCKTRCESVEPTITSDGLGDLFGSKGKRRSVALDQMEARTQEQQLNSRPTSVRSARDQMEVRTRDRSIDRPTTVRSAMDSLEARTRSRSSDRSISGRSARDQMEARTRDRSNDRPTSGRSARDQIEARKLDRSNDRPTSGRSTREQTEDRTHNRSSATKTTDNRSATKSRGRYSVALYATDDNNPVENHTRKSRPSIMSDLIINHKNKYGSSDVEEIFSKNAPSKHGSETKKETDVSNHSKYIDDLLKRIDLSVKANKHTDDQSPETHQVDGKIVRNGGVVEERQTKFVDELVKDGAGGLEKSSKLFDDDLGKNRNETFSKHLNNDDLVNNEGVMDESLSNVDDLKTANGVDNEKEVCSKFNRTLNFDDDVVDDDNDNTFVFIESVCNKTLLQEGDQPSACKLKKLSVIEEEELRQRMSSVGESDASLMESTIRGGDAVGNTDLGVKMAAILDCLQKSQNDFNRRQTEFVEQLKREREEFVKRQSEQIEAFERVSTAFQQEQSAKLAALCEHVANLTNGNNSCATEEEEVFHTAQKKPAESKDSNAIYSSLKTDFKCLKTPNARSNRKAANLNKTILTPHSMSVCVQEQVSLLFDD